jgi:hypothetical protein
MIAGVLSSVLYTGPWRLGSGWLWDTGSSCLKLPWIGYEYNALGMNTIMINDQELMMEGQ